ncbi:SDR family oxidoreductase [Pseudaminobacter arsenicus]|uniref:SDR family oxidoreductase n=1 Tax=Borborobacter arsenicus TaxID=1851146 RepID=A0A432V3H4_9HYPH|nr:SDR family oxidoreductase [Pseudaminobacter arsenicus]RUM96658.1 SDR family oxidoreductase [Pseudaminobacter arsenicus]
MARSIIVTGAASGFGEAIARNFAAAGDAVMLADTNEAGGQRVAHEIGAAGGMARFQHTDVADTRSIQQLIEATLEWRDGIDVLVNNAGITHPPLPAEAIEEEEFDRIFAVNFKSVYLLTTRAIPSLRARRGCIVNIASITAEHPRWGQSVYAATKGAMISFTRALAIELAPDGVRVNAVAPVASLTGMTKDTLGSADPQARRRQIEATIPLGRLGEASDIAGVVTFLASPAAAFLTGMCVPIDGGRSI